jgi:hypothetical protein
MWKSLTISGVLALALMPVAAFGETPADAKPSPDTAWFVIGIQPATARVEIDEPWVRNDRIFSFHYNLTMYHSDEGFIIVKAQPDKLYGVAASSLMWGKSIFGIRYKPCGHVPTFKASGGKVVYFTTIAYRSSGATSSGTEMDFREGATYSQDLDGARAFLQAHYPGLSDSLEQGQYEMMPMARECR